MFLDNDSRTSKRFDYQSTIMLEDENGGYFSYGQLSNYSEGGIGFFSDFLFRPGSKIKIVIDKVPFKASPKIYHGKVQWCREIDEDESRHAYSVGVKY
jgi:hypothetical protein